MEQPVDGELHHDLVWRRVGSGAEGDGHAGANAPGVDDGQRLQGFVDERFADAAARKDAAQRFTACEGVDALAEHRHWSRDDALLCAQKFFSWSSLREWRRRVERRGNENRDDRIRRDACNYSLQSICLRMNVGISISLRSWVALSTGVVRGGRETSFEDVRPLATPLTRAGRL